MMMIDLLVILYVSNVSGAWECQQHARRDQEESGLGVLRTRLQRGDVSAV